MGLNLKMLPDKLWSSKNVIPNYNIKNKIVSVSIIAISDIDGVRFYKIINGSVNAKEFIFFLAETFSTINNIGINPNDFMVVLDNASIHTAKVVDMFKKHLNLCYLPAYSPHLNLIEYHFASWKYSFKIENHRVPINDIKTLVAKVLKRLVNVVI